MDLLLNGVTLVPTGTKGSARRTVLAGSSTGTSTIVLDI
jgi:hypothetical protein